MQCPFPVMRRVSSKDLNVPSGYIQTPCGICEICRKNFAHMWGTRVYHESLGYDKCCFVTLTYSPDTLPFGRCGYPTIEIEDVQGFFKRWREYIAPEKIRYFCGCEYSPLNHLPHYHAAVFGASMWDKRVFTNHVLRDGGYSVDCRFWNKGYVHVGNLEIGSACYVAGYALKKVMGSKNKDYYKNMDIVPPRALMSRNPGIGADFMYRNEEVLKRLGSCTVDSWIVNLPRYYADKLDVKNTERYLQNLDEHQKKMYESWQRDAEKGVFAFQDEIRRRFEVQEFYRDKEFYHNQLIKDWKVK